MDQDVPFSFTLYGPPDAGLRFARCLGARRGIARPLSAQDDAAGTARRLSMHLPGVTGLLVEGTQGDYCAITLSGDQAAIGEAVLRLAEAGAAPAAPEVPEPPLLLTDLPADAAFAALVGTLGAALRFHVPGAIAGTATEPVHQMRVAVRRLRSAIGLFRRVADGPALTTAAHELKTLMRLLGPARDWDVFLADTGPAIARIFPDEADVSVLLDAASWQRDATYAALTAYLEGPAFRVLGVRLAWIAVARPWQVPPDAPQALERLAARTLARRWTRMTAGGPDIGEMAAPALHALRLQGKRMRYACEFFQPLFSGRAARRWIRRLARLQDRLGLLNDAATAGTLMAQLGPAGAGLAGGLVRGYVAAAAAGARPRIARSFRRLQRLEPFWE